jgi:Pregnancy-associated plasma protein-A
MSSLADTFQIAHFPSDKGVVALATLYGFSRPFSLQALIDAVSAGQRRLQIRIQAIATANQDGSQGSTLAASDLITPIKEANEVFAKAGIEFLYNPAQDFMSINNTVLNNTETILVDLEDFTNEDQGPDSLDTTKAPNTKARTSLAALYAQKLVVYFSYGTQLHFDNALGHWNTEARASDSSGWDGLYLSMNHDLPVGVTLAHELGHYLQLHHTFGSRPKDKKAAHDLIYDYVKGDGYPREDGKNVFDGDLYSVADTPPDVGDLLIAKENPDNSADGTHCGPINTVKVSVKFEDGPEGTKDYTLTPDRSFVMSYFQDCPGPKKFSPHQITRIRKGLETGIRHRLISLRASNLKRLVARKGTGPGGEVSGVDVAHVADGRVVTAVRTAGGNLKLIVWDISADGAQVTRKGEFEAGPATDIKVCGFAIDLVVTALRDDNDDLKLIAWQINANGEIERKGSASSDAIQSLAMCRISIDYAEYVVTAVRENDDNLKIIAWQLTPHGHFIRTGEADVGDVEMVSISSAGIDCVATYIRDSDGNLKVILWQVTSEEIIRKGHATEGTIDGLSGCNMDLDLSIAAVRTNGHLKVIAWQASDDQLVLERIGDSGDDAGAVKEIATCRMGTDLLVTAVREADDKLKVILWELVAEGAKITRRDSNEYKAASQIAVCYAGPAVFTTAVRRHDGNLEVSAWQVS